MRVRQCSCVVLIAALLTVAACAAVPPDRRSQVDRLTEQVRALPGVISANSTFNDNAAAGPSYFELDVNVVDNIAADQLATIASTYLDNLQADNYTGYRAEMDVRSPGDVFLVDSGGRPVNNRDQIVAQARSFVALRDQFRGGTVGLRATTSHAGDPPGRAVPSSGAIQLRDTADYVAVAAAVDTLARAFGELSDGEWTITAGRQHPAEIHTSRRLPNAHEMDLWNVLNADQSIPHADVFTINGAVTGPLWVSEKTPADDVAMALRLAELHLPIVAKLAPVLYSASNQYQGRIGFSGQATGPVTVLVGGCIKRDYRPSPAEQTLIDKYGNCRR